MRGAVKRAVSFVLRQAEDPRRVLIVRRPPDDADLPNVWGLPAASVRAGESWEDAVRRAGIDKLGVRLLVGRELRHGSLERRDYTLEMRLFDATIRSGEPSVPQPYPEVTQYTEWEWGEPARLEDGAARGSLCCRLFLETVPSDT